MEIPFGKYYQQGNNSSYVEIIDNSKLRFVNIDFTDYWYRLCDVVVDEYDNKICDDSTMKDAILTALKKPLSYTRIDSERVELFAYIEDGSILGLFLYFSPDDLSFEVENRKYILEYN
ncbi:MAG: hypothetical protein LBC71_00465 [Oscillospiraceae bacterium]|nr:hypothetical protein [Oscillospiraceae bacterium]